MCHFLDVLANSLKSPSYRGRNNTKIVSKVFNEKYKKFNSAKNPCLF